MTAGVVSSDCGADVVVVGYGAGERYCRRIERTASGDLADWSVSKVVTSVSLALSAATVGICEKTCAYVYADDLDSSPEARCGPGWASSEKVDDTYV